MRQKKQKALSRYLVFEAQLGDRKAMAQLVELWDRPLKAHAGRLLQDAEIAGDAVQEAWIEIIKGLRRLDDEDAFPAWAYRIVSRRCARIIKMRQKQRALATAVLAESELPNDGADDMERHAERHSLEAAMHSLSNEAHAAIALFYLEDMRVAEIAVALDLPVGTVKTRLMNARKKLRSFLEGENDGQA